MLFCDNCNGGYHLFCFKPKLTQILANIWYCSSCSPATPWFLLKPCHTFPDSGLGGIHENFILGSSYALYIYMCVCIFFLLINFCLWLVLVLLFSRVCYGFTPLQHRTSQHYMSWHKKNTKIRLAHSYFSNELTFKFCPTQDTLGMNFF
jgi:hypothetical protein